MKEFIKRRLREEISVPSLSLAKNIEISDAEKQKISQLGWSDLIIDQTSETSPVKMKVDVPWKSVMSNGIALDLQVVNDALYQIHISLAPELRGLGLGFKTYKALIMDYGHLYSGIGRRQNVTEVPKIWARLESDPQISCSSNNTANICIANNNPNKEDLLKIGRF